MSRSPVSYAATTIDGLEHVAWDEIMDRDPDAACDRIERGMILFRSDDEPEALLRLGTVEDVFVTAACVPRADLGEHPVSRLPRVLTHRAFEQALAVWNAVQSAKGRQASFRVIARMSGSQAFRRRDVQGMVESIIFTIYPRWKRVQDDAVFEFWADLSNARFHLGLRLSDRTIRHRPYKVAHVEASLRPVVARAMVRLSRPSAGDVVLDPMCGAGTLLIERALGGRHRLLLGGDVNPIALAAAAENFGPRHKPRYLLGLDASRLPVKDGVIDRVFCNLPFGGKVGSTAKNRRLYPLVFGELTRTMRRGGTAVLLASEPDLVESAAKRTGMLVLDRRLPIVLLGHRAWIFVYQRRG